MYQTAEEAITAATPEAKDAHEVIAVVKDQMSANYHETFDRPFFYCPLPAVSLLHKWGTVVAHVFPSGKVATPA